MTTLGPGFEPALAAGHSLQLFIGIGLADELSLTRTAATIDALKLPHDRLTASRIALLGRAAQVHRGDPAHTVLKPSAAGA